MFDAWILPSRVVEPNKKVPDLNCGIQDLLLDEWISNSKQEVSDLRSGGIPPNLTPAYGYVCLSVRKLISRSTTPNFTRLPLPVAWDCSSCLLQAASQHVMCLRFYGYGSILRTYQQYHRSVVCRLAPLLRRIGCVLS